MRNFVAFVAVAGMIALSGCSSGGDSDDPQTLETAEVVEEPAVVEPVEAAEVGSQESPVPLGETGNHGGWSVVVNSWQPNINSDVEAAGDDLSMLEPGKQYALLNMTITWNGDGTGPIEHVNMGYIPDGGNMVANSWEAYGTTPGDNKLSYVDLVPGGTVTGDMLYSVDEGNETGVFVLNTPDADGSVYMAAH